MSSPLSPCCSSTTQGPHDISIYNPTENQPPAKRLKRLFYDPERMPTMELVFSEYDSKKGTFGPSLRDGTPSPSFRPQSPSSQNEMSTVVEDPSYFPSRPLQHHDNCNFTTSSPRSCLSEQALSHQLEHISLIEEGSQSSDFPCSPISREDALGSPLQACIEAYVEADRGFRPPSLPNELQRRDKEIPVAEPTPQSFDSTESSAPSSLFSTASSSTRRGRSSTWSSDVTTVGSSSLSSVPEHKGLICARSSMKRRPPYVNSKRLSPEGMDVPETHCVNAADDRGWDTETITDVVHPFLSILQEECGGSGVTGAASRISTSTPSRCVSAKRHAVLKKDISSPIEADGDKDRDSVELVSEDEGFPTRVSQAKNGRLTTMTASLRHRYVGLSYKVRLALFRTEKRVAKRFSRRSRVQVMGGGDVT